MGAKTPRHSLKAALRVCGVKRRFQTYEAADAECKAGLKPYLCPACGHYHLTSVNSPSGLKGSNVEEIKPTFETSVLGRAKKPKTAKPEVSRETVAVCQGKARPDGRVLVLVDGKEMQTEPVQPATLRALLKQGVKVKVVYRTGAAKSARVLGVVG